MKCLEQQRCNGCAACCNICPQQSISMQTNGEGFLYPVINRDTCIKCGLCTRICPLHNKQDNANNLLEFYSAYCKNDEIRLNSSSGGMFSVMATYVIDNGGVVFGATMNEKLEVFHCAITKADDLHLLRKSKYIQSIIGDTYKQVERLLRNGKRVLFSGTPCQIVGLKHYLQQEYEKLITIDVACHGVSSMKVLEKYVLCQENKVGATVQNVNFRDKKTGWKNYSISFQCSDGMEYSQNHWDDWMLRAYIVGLSLRQSCYDCVVKGLERESDITLGDLWGIDTICKEMNDDYGVSLVVLHSLKGKILFENIKNDIICKRIEGQDVLKSNSSLLQSTNLPKERNKFFEDINKTSFDKVVNKYCPDSLRTKISKSFRNLISYLLKHR